MIENVPLIFLLNHLILNWLEKSNYSYLNIVTWYRKRLFILELCAMWLLKMLNTEILFNINQLGTYVARCILYIKSEVWWKSASWNLLNFVFVKTTLKSRSHLQYIYLITLMAHFTVALACPKALLISRFWGGLALPCGPLAHPLTHLGSALFARSAVIAINLTFL